MPKLTYKRRNTYEENSLIFSLNFSFSIIVVIILVINQIMKMIQKIQFQLKIAFQQVEMTKVVMRIKISNTVKVPKNPKNAVVLDYGALDVLKEMGVADKVKGLPKGENNESLPSFLSEFKKDKYINTGNLKEINFDKIAKLNRMLFIFQVEQPLRKSR